MTEPTLEEIWSVRREIYAECDNDPYKLVAYYIAQQDEAKLPEKYALEEA
ncbi:MAG: hypothetical protein ACOVSW_00205 [Candidatus Kapaibacteriota bacterium]|jgi:hypothetical protein